MFSYSFSKDGNKVQWHAHLFASGLSMDMLDEKDNDELLNHFEAIKEILNKYKLK